MTRRKTLAFSAVLLVLATVFAVVVAEVFVRVVMPFGTATAHQDSYGLFMHYPGITRYLPRHDQRITINSAGMRDREHSLEKADGTFRILVLGDSFMEAYQVAFEDAFSSLIERGLNERAPDRVEIEVINAGVSGWGTDDQLRYLTRYGLEYEPDFVLVAMTLHNDVSDNLRQYWRTIRDGQLVDRNRPPLPWLEYKVLQFKAFLSVRFQVVQLWRQVRRGAESNQTNDELNAHVLDLFREPGPERIQYGYQLTELLLEEMASVTRENGIPMALVLLPIEYQLSDESFASTIVSAVGADSVSSEKPQDVVKAVAATLDVQVIDLLPAFRARAAQQVEPMYIAGDGHWNESGHVLAADVVIAELDLTPEPRSRHDR